MRRWLSVLFGVLVTLAVALAPSASAGDAPIGKLGDTLRVDYDGVVAEFTLNGVSPTFLQPGMALNRTRGIIWRADMTVRAVEVPAPFVMAVAFTYDGVTPFGDAYISEDSDAADGLENVLINAPQGSTVNGAAFFDVYRAPMSNVIVRSALSGVHLAQWNLT